MELYRVWFFMECTPLSSSTVGHKDTGNLLLSEVSASTSRNDKALEIIPN